MQMGNIMIVWPLANHTYHTWTCVLEQTILHIYMNVCHFYLYFMYKLCNTNSHQNEHKIILLLISDQWLIQMIWCHIRIKWKKSEFWFRWQLSTRYATTHQKRSMSLSSSVANPAFHNATSAVIQHTSCQGDAVIDVSISIVSKACNCVLLEV